MPEPIGRSQRYMPGLDGLRAIAVLAVIAYHLGFSWAPGGLLGVGVFFTLSGYLITDLLLAQSRRGTLRLSDFWARRARRLLPALFVMLAAVSAWVALVGPPQPTQFREAVAAAALYVANWQLVFQHVSYFARFGPPSPLGHLWSLGVEEQFYIVWPLLLLLGLRFVKEASRPELTGVRPRLAGLTLLLAAGSALEMALLYRPSFDPSRVYYGTDTRAFELLIGAALAMVWPSWKLRSDIALGAVRVLDAVGVLCLIAIVVMVWRVGEFSPFLYQGGFVLLSFATAVLVAALAHPASRLGGWLGKGPLRWLGVRSYGIYLWHYPIIVLSTPAGAHGVNLLRAAAQLTATIVVAALSWRFVEQPVRRGGLSRAWRRMRSADWRPAALPREGWAAIAIAIPLIAVASIGLAGTSLGSGIAGPPADGANGDIVGASFTATKTVDGVSEDGPLAASNGGRGPEPAGGPPGEPLQGGLAAAGPPEGGLRSSCRSVVDIGDSTSEGLISPDYLPNPKHRIEWQYAHVGVSTQHYEIAGARSIVERYEGQPNAYEVAQEWKRKGYHGCWVLALGTNDAADVAVGSKIGMSQRIEEMMSLIGDEPVMWVNVKSLLSSGPYAEKYMAQWDEALLDVCGKYPTMHVFDWASIVKNEWFISDGIHFNTPGYRERARTIAEALARSFPEHGQERGCVVA